MKNTLFIFLSLLVFSCSGTKNTSRTPGVKFTKRGTLTEIIDLAIVQQKLVYVDFYTDWCTPCKMMVKDVYSDVEIGKLMNDNFVCYKINAERNNGPNLAFLYEVESYPTLLFLDLKGNVIKRKNGAAYHSELTRMINEVLVR